MQPGSSRRVRSADGTSIAVHEYGGTAPSDAPVLVCVHGYPDNAGLWDAVAEELGDVFRVVAYDVRGAGGSDQPGERSAYRLARLEEDFAAVLDAVSPQRPVWLLAHDWGSIQSWHFVTGGRLPGRVEAFVSVSGPSLEHARWFFRHHRPVRDVLRQAVHSWYLLYFLVPWLPERLWRTTWLRRRFERGELGPAPSGRSVADYVNGLELYRANLGRAGEPDDAGPRGTGVPVLVVTPDRDAYVTPPMQTAAARWVPNLTVERVRGTHWLPRNEPGLIAGLVREHRRRVAGWSS